MMTEIANIAVINNLCVLGHLIKGVMTINNKIVAGCAVTYGSSSIEPVK